MLVFCRRLITGTLVFLEVFLESFWVFLGAFEFYSGLFDIKFFVPLNIAFNYPFRPYVLLTHVLNAFKGLSVVKSNLSVMSCAKEVQRWTDFAINGYNGKGVDFIATVNCRRSFHTITQPEICSGCPAIGANVATDFCKFSTTRESWATFANRLLRVAAHSGSNLQNCRSPGCTCCHGDCAKSSRLEFQVQI